MKNAIIKENIDMLFSSNVFLYLFLPVCIILYYITQKKYRNVILLIASIIFYAWGEPVYILLLILSIFINWLFALFVDKYKQTSKKKAIGYMVIAIILNILIIGYFKYSGFIIENIENLFGISIDNEPLPLPIGISFFTFQGVSYLIDVYRGHGDVQKNPVNVALYISLFPQLIAGPIVRYETIAEQLKERYESVELFASGVKRFVQGLAKKVLLSNIFAVLADIAFDGDVERTVLLAWMGAVAYAMQIYYDFSGYSDMAIGLGRMFGFKFLENFDYPYISKSITEFWRRWHISLSTWFRDYVYIPLGGNRKGKARQIFNLFVVWLLTGIWHGANWTFIAWGLYFFVFLIVEKLFLLKILNKLPVINWVYSIVIVLGGWVLFRSASMGDAFSYLQDMFMLGGKQLIDDVTIFYLKEYMIQLIIGMVFCVPVFRIVYRKVQTTIEQTDSKAKAVACMVAEYVCILGLLLLCMASLVANSYNPFIYFNF